MRFNPHIKLDPWPDDNKPTIITITAPVQGEACRITAVRADEDPEFFSLIVDFVQKIEKGKKFELPLQGPMFRRLRETGVILPAKLIPEPPAFERALFDSELVSRILQDKRYLTKARAAYAKKLYVRIPDMLSAGQIEEIARYYRLLMSRGFLPLAEGDETKRYYAYNEPLARLIHLRLQKLVSVIAGEKVQPSFVYFSSYVKGSELPPHKDRPQCDYSITLLIDFRPQISGPTPWPIFLQRDRGKPVAIHQSIGEGLFYRGCQLKHWRLPFTAGTQSTHLFLHYVSERFTGSLR